MYGLYPRKGAIAVGADADIAIWDPERRVRISSELLHDACDYTPYEGLEVTGWPNLLDQQAARIENPDRKERFQFVRPAVSADPAVRDAFFERLKDRASRQREPWVLEGLGYLHHPIRAASAEQYIPPSLAMLREIQRTGDIFFPKRWMDATLGGHSSASAARMVSRFLAELPADYPDRLRRVILSSSDDLFRASGIDR